MTRFTTLLLSSSILALSSLAFAGDDMSSDTQSQPQSQTQEQGTPSSDMQAKAFSEVDADNSGTLDESEAQVANIDDFQAADENGDGTLDRNEYYSAVTEQQAS